MGLARIQFSWGALLFGITFFLVPYSSLYAEFVLDWNADTASPTFSGTSIVQGGTTITGQTPFVYERVPDPVSGALFYHLIVGDPAQQFAQEVYIQTGGGLSFEGFGNIGTSSASGGSGLPTGNASDPLGVVNDTSFTGNGTAHPRRVQMREILNDADFSMDFTKNVYIEKPTISLNINGTDFQNIFVIDASGIGYDDDTTASVITNTMQIDDPNIPEGSGTFDMATDSQDSIITAGKYTYTSGTGNLGANGTYTYAEDSFNVDNIEWENYFDPSQTNPWGYTDNRP